MSLISSGASTPNSHLESALSLHGKKNPEIFLGGQINDPPLSGIIFHLRLHHLVPFDKISSILQNDISIKKEERIHLTAHKCRQLFRKHIPEKTELEHNLCKFSDQLLAFPPQAIPTFVNKSRLWSKEEKQALKYFRDQASLSFKQIAPLMSRTARACKEAHPTCDAPKKPVHHWSKKEITHLVNLRTNGLDWEQIGKKLSLPRNMCRDKYAFEQKKMSVLQNQK